MDNFIHLQGIGKVKAKPAGNFKVGEKALWNYGYTSTIKNIQPVGKTGNFHNWTTQEDKSGGIYQRRVRKDRLVGYY